MWLQSFLKRHHWLAVSDVHGGLYCKYCVLFAPPDVGSGRRSTVCALVKGPLKSFSKQNPSLDILNRLDAQRRAEVQDNRERLLPILKSIVFCGQQNIALRGHRDDGSLLDGHVEAKETGSITQNDGNFRALLRFRIDAGDEKLKNHLEKSSSRSTYIGKNSQNELIACCGEEIRENICNEVRESPWFSIIFDETTDGSHKELMSVSIRYIRKSYVKGKGMVTTVCEKFLCYVDCYQAIRSEDISESGEKRLTGKALGNIVVDLCAKHNLDIKNRCVGVGTDNCAVMASEMKGAVAEIQKHAPLAVRCPCLNHILNNSPKFVTP